MLDLVRSENSLANSNTGRKTPKLNLFGDKLRISMPHKFCEIKQLILTTTDERDSEEYFDLVKFFNPTN